MADSQAAQRQTGFLPLISVVLTKEQDLVTARQRARQIAQLLGFGKQDQSRVVTATSEIARNVIQYAGAGRVEFGVNFQPATPVLVVQVIDDGPGIKDPSAILQGRYQSATGMGLGIIGARRLMDDFDLDSSPGRGTRVEFSKHLPSPGLTRAEAGRISEDLIREGAEDAYEELQRQNQELLTAFHALHERETELERREAELRRLNQELEETNRGVVALYAELEEKAEALRSANEIKSRFLSHMSHEFRTPLNSILALASLLQRRTDGDLSPDQEKQVGYIQRAAGELFEIVNDLLDLAKVEAGKAELKPARIEVAQLLGALRGMLRPLATNEAVLLNIEEPEPGLYLVTDEGKLGQILRNLVSNALKFTEHGEVRLSAKASGMNVIFAVCDTGIGIAPEHQKLIFQDFTQIDHAIQRKVKGTGLGLPLSRKLAELMGGSLSVQSSPGTGSEFTLSLPRGETVRQQADAALEVSGGEDSETILIIDDEELARYLVRQLFRGTRYRFIEAGTGVEGAERARFEKPRLIMLDLNMPDRNGFDVLDDLKADPSTAGIPVVLHTSVTLRNEDMSRLAGRHSAVLPKQLSGREEAFRVIRDILGEPQLFS